MALPPDTPCVSIRNLTVRFPGASGPALDGLSLDVRRGEVVGVVGLTGSGKTTLALCLNGVVPHLVTAEVSGEVRVDGLDPVSTPVHEMARRVGMVFDDPEPRLSQGTVAEEAALGLEQLGVPWQVMVERVAGVLDAVGLSGLGERAPTALSGGEQQRLSIACALAVQPSLLVMDEPTTNLDPSGKAAVFDLVRRLNREQGLTVIVAEHDVERLAEHADRIVVLAGGRVAMDGSPAEVFGRVSELDRLGIRAPEVTQIAAAVAGGSSTGAARRPGPLPVTVEAALAWLGSRA